MEREKASVQETETEKGCPTHKEDAERDEKDVDADETKAEEAGISADGAADKEKSATGSAESGDNNLSLIIRQGDQNQAMPRYR